MEDNETIPGMSASWVGPLFATQCALSPLLQERFELKPLQRDASKRDTKRIGDISEAQVIAALTKLGYHVLLPFGKNNRYDVVIDDGDELYRVQVKTRRLREGTSRPYFGQIDYLAVYCPETEKVYVLPEKELTATNAHLRVLPTRNNMKKTIRWATEFELS